MYIYIYVYVYALVYECSQVEAFHMNFLQKVTDVKDNVSKQPLLHHLVAMVMERFPDGNDLHSGLGATHRVAKVSVSLCLQWQMVVECILCTYVLFV